MPLTKKCFIKWCLISTLIHIICHYHLISFQAELGLIYQFDIFQSELPTNGKAISDKRTKAPGDMRI